MRFRGLDLPNGDAGSGQYKYVLGQTDVEGLCVLTSVARFMMDILHCLKCINCETSFCATQISAAAGYCVCSSFDFGTE